MINNTAAMHDPDLVLKVMTGCSLKNMLAPIINFNVPMICTIPKMKDA